MPTPQSRLKWLMQTLGPGMAVAATGVGAGDLVAASVAGAKFGTAVLWAAVVGALLKFAVNEGIARWQLATQTTLLEGWTQKLHRSISVYFLVYLVLWSFFVAGALISACGLAGYSLFGFGSVQGWGIVHSIAAAAFVYWGRYRYFETMMKFFIGLMFMAIILCAALILPEVDGVLYGLVLPSLPAGSTKFIFGVIGGVGGSVTLLSYGYWIREKSWLGSEHHTRVRVDLITAYALTGIFGVAVMIIAAGVSPQVATGTGIVLALADRLAKCWDRRANGCFWWASGVRCSAPCSASGRACHTYSPISCRPTAVRRPKTCAPIQSHTDGTCCTWPFRPCWCSFSAGRCGLLCSTPFSAPCSCPSLPQPCSSSTTVGNGCNPSATVCG
ncbi:MAG: Nramp family divalent metal transporter [candidate division KSB1 bacterium]|nr:Nramp family divalent metal transporter [candidate division KSB1 bacterium]